MKMKIDKLNAKFQQLTLSFMYNDKIQIGANVLV